MNKKSNNEKKSLDLLIGEQLEEKRLSKHYTLQMVADYLNTTKVTIHNYEKGVSSMDISTIIEICSYLGLDYIQVLENAKVTYYGK